MRVSSHRSSRRGMAVLLVLGVLAITLAVCYATLRGQGTTAQLARNNSRALQARAAAHSGLAAALRKMSESTWSGVGVPLTRRSRATRGTKSAMRQAIPRSPSAIPSTASIPTA